MQIDELAPSMGHAADRRDTFGEALLVAAVVIADQVTLPATQEVTRSCPRLPGVKS